MTGINRVGFGGRRAAVPADAKRSRGGGFTLVELLVVVVIIAMLVGLLLPAVLSARARARITQCTNNQRELGTAVINYATQKQHLPGYANTIYDKGIDQNVAVSWIPVLLPFLGRNDLWKGDGLWRSYPDNASSNPNFSPGIGQLVCPSVMSKPSGPMLTYTVNVGPIIPDETDSTTQQGVFRNRAAGVPDVFLSDIPSHSQRPMISESTYLANVAAGPVNRYWNLTSDDPAIITANQFGFIWPLELPLTSPTHNALIGEVLPPIHPGIVIVTFCDGHVESLSEDGECRVYDWQPIQ